MAVLGAVVLIAVATAGDVGLVEGPPSISWTPGPIELPDEMTSPSGAPEPDPEPPDADGPDIALPHVVTVIVRTLLLVCIGLLALAGALSSWRNRPRLTWRRRRPPDDFDGLDDVATAVTAGAAAQRAALARGAPRNAIVECWVRLEASVAEAGLARDAAETTAELTARVLSRFRVEPAAIADLASLYREARFSTHPMGEAERTRAIVALEALHEGLRPGAVVVVAP